MRLYREDGAYRSPIVAGDTLFVAGAGDKDHQQLTARTLLGDVLWTASRDVGSGTASPALGHGVIVIPGQDGGIEGYRASDGSHLWTHPVGENLYDMVSGWRNGRGTTATPAITDSVVYIGSLDGNLYALELGSGTELWRWELGTPIASSVATMGNMIYVGASDGHLYAFVGDRDFTGLSVDPLPSMASVFGFYPPRPNPSVTNTELVWVLPERARVSLRLYDVQGRLVRELVDQVYDPGEHAAVWDGRDRRGAPVAAGVYFARLQAGRWDSVRKFVRLRH